MEDDLIERKMQVQQQDLTSKEKHELAKEGRGVKEERKRNVRRDLFEPSTDNPTAYGASAASQHQKSQKFEAEVPQKQGGNGQPQYA